MQLTLTELWQHMGLGARLITLTMLAMSLVALAVVCERAVALMSARRQSLAYARTLAALLEAGELERAAAQPPAPTGPLGRVLAAGLAAYGTLPRDEPDFALDAVARVLERKALREVHTMRRGVALLASVSSTAPFVGLLGTVLGIVSAFELMAQAGAGGLAVVSGGVAEALVTTALGLLVAIPSMAAYNALTAVIDARALDLAEAGNELLERIAHALARDARARGETPSMRPRPSAARSG